MTFQSNQHPWRDKAIRSEIQEHEALKILDAIQHPPRPWWRHKQLVLFIVLVGLLAALVAYQTISNWPG